MKLKEADMVDEKPNVQHQMTLLQSFQWALKPTKRRRKYNYLIYNYFAYHVIEKDLKVVRSLFFLSKVSSSSLVNGEASIGRSSSPTPERGPTRLKRLVLAYVRGYPGFIQKRFEKFKVLCNYVVREKNDPQLEKSQNL